MRKPALSFACSVLMIASPLIAQTTIPPAARPAEAIDLTSTQRVTLHLKSAMPDVAVAAFSARTGIPMRLTVPDAGPSLPPYPVKAYDFDVDNEPLVQAMVRLDAVYDLNQTTMYGEEGVSLVKRAPMDNPFATSQPAAEDQAIPPICITGPFAVVANEIIAERSCDPLPIESPAREIAPSAARTGQGDQASWWTLASMSPQAIPPFFSANSLLLIAGEGMYEGWIAPAPAGGAAVADNAPRALELQRRLRLQLKVMAEPQITILGISSPPSIDTMLDDQDEPLWDPQQQGGQMVEPAYDNAPDAASFLELRDPVAGAASIVSLKGSFHLHVVTRSRRYEWTNLDRPGPRTQVIDGLRVTIESLEDDSGTPTQQAIINIDTNGMDPRLWMEKQDLIGHGSQIQFYDKTGKVISEAFRWYPFNGIQFQIDLPAHRNADGSILLAKPFRMTWDFPLEAGDVQVPFSFDHLPLPRG